MRLNQRLLSGALALTLLCGIITERTLAAGPGELSGSASSEYGPGAALAKTAEDPWSGYINEDGSPFTYAEKGITVSKFQNLAGSINWASVKASGIDFVIVRLAYGLTEDPYFDENVRGAQAAGLKVGVYLCSTARTLEEATAEAELTLDKIRKYKLDYPVSYDVEDESMRQDGLSREGLTAMINRYCGIIKQAGYTPILYANKTWLSEYMNLGEIPYELWYALYAQDKVYRPLPGKNTSIWQTGDKGTVGGIKGYVTTEFSRLSYGGGVLSPKPAGMEAGKAGAESAAGGPGNALPESAAGSFAALQGWRRDASGKWFYYENGTAVTGWKKIEGFWYYMKEDGAMLENTAELIDGREYRFNESGAWIEE